MVHLTYKNLFKIDILLVFLFFIIPMVGYLNYAFRGVYTTWPIFLLWFAFILIKNKNHIEFFKVLYKRKINIILLLIFIWIVALNHFFVDSNSKSLQYTVVFINFLIIYIIDSYYSIKGVSNRYAILYLCLIGLGVQAAISIPYILLSPGFVTRAYSAGLLTPSESLEAIKNGVGNNSLYSSAAIFLFAFIPVIKNTSKGAIKTLVIISSFVILITCLIATFLLPLLLLIVGVFATLIYKIKFDIKNLIKIASISLLLILTLIFTYNHIMTKFPLFRNQISKIERSLQGGKIEDPSGRTTLNQVSIQTFKDNPLFGIGIPEWQSYDKIGEHNTWVDYLANFGFLGVLPLYLFLLIRLTNRYIIENDYLVKFKDIHYLKISIFLFIIANLFSPLITNPNTYQMFLFLYTSIQFNQGNSKL